MRDDQGRLLGFAQVTRDITGLKQAEKQLKDSRQQLRALAAYLQSVREEERTRIAREVHDELGQALTGLKMDLAWLDKRNNEIRSTDDIALGRKAAELTRDYVDGPYRFEILEGISHWVPEQAPDRVAELVLEHMAAHPH